MKKHTFYKALLISIVTLVIAIPSTSEASGSDSDYYSLVQELKGNGKNIDFQALRLAYTKTADYQPYGQDETAINAAYAALKIKNYDEAIKQAEIALKKNYVNLDMHMLCMIAFRESGNHEKSAYHNAILKGLFGSIYSSGDGTSPEKAYVVISVPEEYVLLNVNGLKMLKNSAMTINGHKYDKAEVENIKTKEKSIIYFNIDIPYGWLTQNLKKKP